MKLNALVLALPVLCTFSFSTLAATLPDRFEAKEKTPDMQAILDNPDYVDGLQGVKDRWLTNNIAALRTSQYISGEEINRTFTNESTTQEFWVENNAFSIDNTINSVQMMLKDGGTAVGTIVKGDLSVARAGHLALESGSKAYDTTVENHASINTRLGAESYNTYVKKGGLQVVGDYAQANFIDGGEQNIMMNSTGEVEDTIIINGGEQYLWGGTAKNTHISGTGSYQLASGLAINSYIYEGAYQLVYAGSDDNKIASQDATIYAGGTQRVQAGVADGTKVYGLQIVSSEEGNWRNHQWEAGNTILNRGQKATNSIIYAGGEQRVEWYAITENTLVDGGHVAVNATGGIKNTTVKNGGTVAIAFGGYSGQALNIDNGSLTMEGGDVHPWSNFYLGGKGAWANEVSLNSADANLYLKYNGNTTESTVTIGTLNSNGGFIIFGSKDGSDSGKFSRLDLSDLTGSGTIVMNTNIQGGAGDFLYIENKLADLDSFDVVVRDSGNEIADYRHHLISAGLDSTEDSFVISGKRSRADAGAYTVEYTLEHSTNGSTSLEDWHLIASRAGRSASTDAVLAMSNVTPTVWDAELSTLRQRLGDLENDTGSNGMWGRYISSRYKVDKESGAAYKQDMNGFVLGADRAYAQENGTMHYGFMTGYSKSDIDFKRGGEGKVDSYTLGAYASFMGNSGLYVDSVLKYNYFRNKTDARSTGGDLVSGKYNTSGVGLSVELGKKYERENLFSIPYVMLSGFYAGDADYTLSNGLRAHVDRAASVKAEFGHVLGKNFNFSNGGNFKPYLKLAVNQELVNSNYVRINDTERFNNDMSGTAMKVGLGATTKLSSGFSAYAEIDYMKATHSSMPYSGNVGIRYTF